MADLISEPIDPRTLLERLPLDDSGAYPLDPVGVSVRPYPYPYRAAFTICNDLDSQRAVAFEAWHGYVNGRRTTDDGEGLGLEIGDSFWIWGYEDLMALHWQYPEEEPRVDSRILGRLVELGRMGWLDTLHSMGNWRLKRQDNGTTICLHAHRDQAAYALDRLDKLGVKPTVYCNHSSSVSNVGGPWGWYQHSDDPEHPFYCLDLLQSFGFKYHWIDNCLNQTKFGDHLVYPSAPDLQRAVRKFPWPSWLRRRDYDGQLTHVPVPSDAKQRQDYLVSFFNRTLQRLQGRDGTPILAFKRQMGTETPIMSRFAAQVTESDLDSLEAMRGVAVIYQHFGLSGPRGRNKDLSVPKMRPTGSPIFDEHAQARWRDIAERFHGGRLWVALTSRLLNYLLLRETLGYWVARQPDKWIVIVKDVGYDAVNRRALTDADLNGLSFLVPSEAPEVVVAVEGRAATLPMKRQADPAWPGYDAIYLPWQALEWPS